MTGFVRYVLVTCSLVTSSSFVTTTTARADLTLTPQGLQPGDTFQLAFVTDGVYDSLSSDISTYNQIVQSVAASAGLNHVNGQDVTWTAIVSTANVNAIANAPQLAPVYDTNFANPDLVAPIGTLYSGTIQNPIQYDEHGAQYLGLVWTGSSAYGKGFDAGSRPLGTSYPTYGITFSYGGAIQWLDYGANIGFGYLPLYALSDPISVPGAAVPEPSTLLMVPFWALAMICYGCVQRSRHAGRRHSSVIWADET
jgi:hypothetical protein